MLAIENSNIDAKLVFQGNLDHLVANPFQYRVRRYRDRSNTKFALITP